MREYIFTDKERNIIQTYLTQGLNLNGFSVLRHRIQRALPQLQTDMDLIHQFLKHSAHES